MDMYKNNFVVAVKANGKILRELRNDNNEQLNMVMLPFGCEYSLLFKNLNSRRAAVSVSIDGEEVIKDGRLVVEANSEAKLERFVDDLNHGNKFKFIQKTEKIQNYRGDRIDDGIIRVEIQYEKPVRYLRANDFRLSKQMPDNYRAKGTSASADMVTESCCNMCEMPQSDEGITVKGSESHQQFRTIMLGEMEETSEVITFQLRGVTDADRPVETPIAVNTKMECPTCGTKNKSSNKFCSECGTHL